MANQRISEMPSVTSLTPSDLVYVVQAGISSHITVEDAFSGLPNSVLTGKLSVDSSEVIVANGGNLSDAHVVTALTVDNTDREFLLSTGDILSPTQLFMIKIVYLKTTASGKAVIKGGLIPELESVTLTNIGDSATFMSTSNGWIYLSGTATVVRV